MKKNAILLSGRFMLIYLCIVFFVVAGCTDQQEIDSQIPGGIPSGTSGSASIPDTKTVSSHESNINEETNNQAVDAAVGTPEVKGELRVHFIDVGQGASQLLIGPSGKTMLIDAGNNDKEKLIVEYIRKENIDRIDILIGTHPDADHIGGLDAVIDNFDIGQIYMPKIQSNTKTFEDMLLAVQRKGLKISTAKAGIDLEWENSVQVKMIAPIGEYSDTNEMSAVIHLTFGDTSFLLTGDAETKSEADMVSSGSNLKAGVLLVSHHGSKTSTSQAFLDEVNPDYAVIQVGKNNYGHPDPDVLKRLVEKNVEVYRNDLQGNIIFTSDGKKLSLALDDWKPAEEKKSELVQVPNTTVPLPIDPPKQEEKAASISATASIDNAKPKQNSTVTVTVTVKDQDGKPVQGAKADLSLKYKSTTSQYDGITDASGIAKITFKISRATIGYTVNGNITVTHGDLKTTAKTNFTPK